MLRIDALRVDTGRLYRLLREDPAVQPFTLIGGTALALHHGHRESEDLDLVWTPDPALGLRATSIHQPSAKAVLDRFRQAGHSVDLAFDQATMDLAADDGGYLLDSHQDWFVDGAKLTFFAAETPDEAERYRRYDTLRDGELKLLTSDALFECKSRLLTRRGTSRDLFDLWWFLTHGGKTLEEVFAFAADQSPIYKDELTKKRLLPRRQAESDPGFDSLLKRGPKDFDDLIAAMTDLVAEYEVREAERVTLDATGGIKP